MSKLLASLAMAAVTATAVPAHAQPYGMGPGGMMGGYGPGPGMMGGGYGPGMMMGMGPGMMGGQRGALWGLDLTPEQRKKIAEIQEDAAKSHWELMGTMHRQGYHMDGMYGFGDFDEQEARKRFQAMTDAHKAMFELSLQTRKRIEAVLTKEQREQLRRR